MMNSQHEHEVSLPIGTLLLASKGIARCIQSGRLQLLVVHVESCQCRSNTADVVKEVLAVCIMTAFHCQMIVLTDVTIMTCKVFTLHAHFQSEIFFQSAGRHRDLPPWLRLQSSFSLFGFPVPFRHFPSSGVVAYERRIRCAVFPCKIILSSHSIRV
jgi:hypothetical protein